MSRQHKSIPSQPDATPADVWRQKTVHTVTGPTGAVSKIRIPGIAGIIERGEMPDYLLGIALLDISHPDGAAASLRALLDNVLDETKRGELIAELRKLAEYRRYLVHLALVEPALTLEQIASGEFPEDDLAMIADIVQRTRAFDARGVRIGVEPLDRWATFHREHGLDHSDSCEHCLRVLQELSSIHVGAV